LNSRIGYAVLIIMILSVAPIITANYPIDSKPKSEGFNQTRFLQEGNQTTPKYGGTLRIGNPKYYTPTTLNPLLDVDTYVRNWFPVFNGLLRYDENGSLIPDLAQSFGVMENGTSIAFHLYENISWHDGVEFNASDVKFTFDSIASHPNVDYRWKDYYAYGIDSTEIFNASTIVFHLNETLGSFPLYMPYVPILPKHVYEGTDMQTNPANEAPIGTGPFRFRSWVPNTNLTFLANDFYFRGRPYLDYVNYNWDFNDTTELTGALENNIIDLTGVDPGRIQELEATTGTTVVNHEYVNYWFLGLNLNIPVLNNINVRKALAHAINKTRIVSEAWSGCATPAKGPIPSSLENWCNPNITDYDNNRTLAEKLLDQQYPRNPQWRFNLTIKSYGEVPWLDNTAYFIADDLRAVGINVTLDFCDAWKYVETGDFEAFVNGWASDACSPDDLYTLFHTGSLVNYWNYSNPELDVLLEQGRTTFNDTLRRIVFDQAQEIIASDLPNIFLFHANRPRGFNNDFQGAITKPQLMDLGFPQYFLENSWYDPTLSGKGNCPMLVSFVDSSARRTGYDPATSRAVNEIPESTYSGLDSDPQLVKIPFPSGSYTIELYGTGNGSYSLEIVNIALDYKHVNVPTGWIQQGDVTKFYVQVDADGGIRVTDTRPDINGDGVVNILDAIILGNTFLSTPTSPNWKAKADVNGDGVVNILDAIVLGNHFLEHYP